jgi:phage N-6-adenine-methyltransferase
LGIIPKYFKSGSDDWWTNPEILKAVLDFIGEEKFACDPCSPDSPNMPARIHYTKEQDGLAQPWPSEGHIWVNPPYGRAMKNWIKKCHDHSVQNPRCEIWLLIPARTGNAYYHELIYEAKTFTFLFKGRLKFWLHGEHEGPIHCTQLSCFSRRYLEYAQRFEREFAFKGKVMFRLTPMRRLFGGQSKKGEQMPLIENVKEKDRIKEIRKLHCDLIETVKSSLPKAIRIGELLTEQKKAMEHGDFGKWVEKNCSFSYRTGRVFMQLYREKDRVKIEWEGEKVKMAESANLTLASALKRITSPRKALPEKIDRKPSVAKPPKPNEPIFVDIDGKKVAVKVQDDLSTIWCDQLNFFPQLLCQSERHGGHITGTFSVDHDCDKNNQSISDKITFTFSIDKDYGSRKTEFKSKEQEVTVYKSTQSKPEKVAEKPTVSEKKEVVDALYCPSCGKLIRLEDADEECPPLWECSNKNCGATFISSDRNCPECNRPFSRKLADYACEDCEAEMEETTAFVCNNKNCGQDGFHLDEEEAEECGNF